jgi:hypothetical protein
VIGSSFVVCFCCCFVVVVFNTQLRLGNDREQLIIYDRRNENFLGK